ncbi:MAG: rod shape-determining protein MreC [Treponema sp.]|jgi:rod shape-determining protein MreC|nr:rod shape-determining protein MreC [Treponema sp.]
MPKTAGKKPPLSFNTSGAVFGGLIIVSFLSLFFSTKSFAFNFKEIGLQLFLGVRNGIYAAASMASGTVAAIQELAVLREEYAELVDRVARYEQIERSAADIIMENRRLREQLGFLDVATYKSIPAQIVGRDPDNLFSAIAINRGRLDGVAVGMPVIAYQNGMEGLVGKVIQTAKFESLVIPLYDARSFVAARLAASRYEGIVEGQGSQDAPLVMRFIQQRVTSEISAGDVVVSSGLGGVYPPEISIGRVTDVNYQEYEISMEIILEPVVDYSRLEYVFVLDKEAVRTEKESVPAEEDSP